ncbi:hypothetical protein DSR90_18440 [Salmonella enterica subsp. enterica serovar Gatuni]|nr:hypothetical protein [Salmonella enterica subsp. enterica serovar Gatuni]
MQHLPAPIHHARDAAQLPVAIDYPAALALRQMSMVHDELPKYLLAPEVSALLHYVPDLRRKMLLALDVAARHRVQFSMPESDAVTMLKNRHA